MSDLNKICGKTKGIYKSGFIVDQYCWRINMNKKYLWKYNFDQLREMYGLHRKIHLQHYVSQALLL
jgi:hypothetical protein